MASSPSATGKGAAEQPEPEPEPGPPSGSTSTTSSYDPREYQPSHPDDRGKPTKKGKGKDKGKDDKATHHCGNCDAPDANRKCTGCGVEYYCGKECQTVRAVWWKSGYCV